MPELGSSCRVLEEQKVGGLRREFVAELGIETSRSGACKASSLPSSSRPCRVERAPASVPVSTQEEQRSPRRRSPPPPARPCHPCMVRLQLVALVPGEVSLTGLPCNLSRFWHSPLRA